MRALVCFSKDETTPFLLQLRQRYKWPVTLLLDEDTDYDLSESRPQLKFLWEEEFDWLEREVPSNVVRLWSARNYNTLVFDTKIFPDYDKEMPINAWKYKILLGDFVLWTDLTLS